MVYIKVEIEVADSGVYHKRTIVAKREAELTLPNRQCVNIKSMTESLVDDALAAFDAGGDKKEDEA